MADLTGNAFLQRETSPVTKRVAAQKDYSEPDKYAGSELDGNVWRFTCSLKNYGDEIERFFNDIVPIISDSYMAIEHYEEWDEDFNRLYTSNDVNKDVYNGTINDFRTDAESFIIEDKLNRIEEYDG